MKNNQKRPSLCSAEPKPVQIVEVSDNVIEFNSHAAASNFLGVHYRLLDNYVTQKTKVIKSKITGKTYLIRKVKQA